MIPDPNKANARNLKKRQGRVHPSYLNKATTPAPAAISSCKAVKTLRFCRQHLPFFVHPQSIKAKFPYLCAKQTACQKNSGLAKACPNRQPSLFLSNGRLESNQSLLF